MPAGQVDLYFNPDLSVFINQKMQGEVTAFDPHAKNLVLSRRNILEREKEEAKDRKSTRLNSSHGYISYAVFCLKKKKKATPAASSRLPGPQPRPRRSTTTAACGASSASRSCSARSCSTTSSMRGTTPPTSNR